METAQDIIDELGALAMASQLPETPREHHERDSLPYLDSDYMQLLDNIGYDPTSVDNLVKTSGLTAAEVSSMLLQLEMNGFLASNPGGMYIRLK